ncbi:CatB-related O-acetyltransferase [Clostridium estertheticum]|uniref:CatB-related O-acetyltransferase n=1 Tax=Clostridium estertheticum TaxID=238834 RepID=UPI001A9A956F|nr:CatB-related O-acetyltransferase [Clostridium estertheticum]
MNKLLIKFFLLCFKIIKYNKVKIALFKIIRRLDDDKHSNLIFLLKKYYNIEVGIYSYGCHKIDGTIESGSIIGRFCSFAPGVRIGGLNHPTKWITTHPILYNGKYNFFDDKTVKAKSVIIEDDVWIGFDAIILGGVKIGKGAIVGAGSVVTKNVLPYSIVAGNPAKVIKFRFSNEEIDSLLKIDWCCWGQSKIVKYIDDFKKPQIFIEKFSDLE